jgi:CDK inhibitor PHO81
MSNLVRIFSFITSGHNYLDKKILIRIQFGSYKLSSLEKSLVRLFGSHQLSTLKLELTTKPDELASYSVSLPLQGMQSYDFLVEELEAFSVQFDVYPMFGSRPIGRAVALPSIFKLLSESSWSGAGEYETCICPLFDSHLNVVGEIEFVSCA